MGGLHEFLSKISSYKKMIVDSLLCYLILVRENVSRISVVLLVDRDTEITDNSFYIQSLLYMTEYFTIGGG